jgi:hypothetical protein
MTTVSASKIISNQTLNSKESRGYFWEFTDTARIDGLPSDNPFGKSYFVDVVPWFVPGYSENIQIELGPVLSYR